MKKIIILVLMLLLVPLNVRAEELPPDGTAITKENVPIHWKYCEDYAQLLKNAFESETKKFHHRRGWGASYDFLITNDGKIKDMRQTIYQNDYFDKIVKNIILSVKPPDFYDGMNEESILFSIYLGYQRYNDVKIHGGSSFRWDRDIFGITIDLNK
mgnify:CR=1 FL=1